MKRKIWFRLNDVIFIILPAVWEENEKLSEKQREGHLIYFALVQ